MCVGPLCCSGASCCGACCVGFDKCGVPAKNFPKVTYVVTSILLMLVSVLLMYTLRYAAESWDWLNCAEVAGGGAECFGISAAFRASFTLVVYHVLILIFIFPRAACSSVLHDGFWFLKNLLMIGLYILSFWIPYQFFVTWGWLCLIISTLFLFIQGYFLLNLAYTWNDALLEAINGRDGTSYA